MRTPVDPRLVVRQTPAHNFGFSACENRRTVSNQKPGDVE